MQLVLKDIDQIYQESSIGKIVITDNQTSGKGSYNKSWYSEPYKDLTFSIILGSSNNFQQNLIDETCSAMVIILNEYQIKAYQKPPNDIYVKDRKIAIERAIDSMSKNSILLVLG